MLFLVYAALAAPRVDPVIEAEGVEAAYRAWALAAGRTRAEAELVCRPFAEQVRLCFARTEAGKRIFYTEADGKTTAALESAGTGTAKGAIAALEPVQVDDAGGRYWISAAADGRDHAAVLDPVALRAKVGEQVVVALPARGVLVAWNAGDPVLDKIIAVGVRRMYDTLPDPVTPLVYRWNEEAWITWGTARAAADAPGPQPIPTPLLSPAALPTPER